MARAAEGLTLAILLGAASALPSRAAVERTAGVLASVETASFDWAIAGNGVNVLSELTWSNLRILAIGARGEFVLRRHLVLMADLTVGRIESGDNRDSDYAGSDRTLLYSRSNNDGGGDGLFEGEFDAGYRLDLRQRAFGRSISVIPFFGYAYRRTKFRMTDGNQTVSRPDLVSPPDAPPPVGPFPGLDSTYDARWQGPAIGVEARWAVGERHDLSLRLVYRLEAYRATANWNLRDDFAHPTSFHQETTGGGLTVTGRFGVMNRPRTKISVALEYVDWTGSGGTDTTYLATGEIEVGPLNSVNWSALTFSVGAEFGF
ncbi:MAG: hypothetical protein LAO51_13720 [Acidobacteriia bacterium]|nr:hypothetical protein [Terriglobia bacterium]